MSRSKSFQFSQARYNFNTFPNRIQIFLLKMWSSLHLWRSLDNRFLTIWASENTLECHQNLRVRSNLCNGGAKNLKYSVQFIRIKHKLTQAAMKNSQVPVVFAKDPRWWGIISDEAHFFLNGHVNSKKWVSREVKTFTE